MRHWSGGIAITNRIATCWPLSCNTAVEEGNFDRMNKMNRMEKWIGPNTLRWATFGEPPTNG